MQIRLIAKPSVKSNVIGGSKFLKLSNWACLEHSDQNLPVFSRSGSKRVLFIFFRRELPHKNGATVVQLPSFNGGECETTQKFFSCLYLITDHTLEGVS